MKTTLDCNYLDCLWTLGVGLRQFAHRQRRKPVILRCQLAQGNEVALDRTLSRWTRAGGDRSARPAEFYYFGGVSGGVWKTVNGGETWEPLTDKEPFDSIGSIAVADSDPNVIYVGTGEGCPRGNVVTGTACGSRWMAARHGCTSGLKTRRPFRKSSSIRDNPDEVFVAALGHVYGPNAERGVYKSSDGGKTWKKVLYKDDKTGAVDITFEPPTRTCCSPPCGK